MSRARMLLRDMPIQMALLLGLATLLLLPGGTNGPPQATSTPTAVPAPEHSWLGMEPPGPLSIQPTGTDEAMWAFVPVEDSHLTAISALGADDVWAVGYLGYVGASEVGQAFAAHWDGTRWDWLGTLDDSLIGSRLEDVVAIAKDDVWAVGTYRTATSDTSLSKALIAHWNGTKWSIVPTPDTLPNYSELRAIAAAGSDDVWAIGSSYLKGRSPDSQVMILHWDGSTWTEILDLPSAGGAYSSGIVVLSVQDIWAANQQSILHWDGKTWTEAYRAPYRETYFTSITAISASDVWVTSFAGWSGGCDHYSVEIMHWDGTAWIKPQIPSLPYNCIGSPSLSAITASSTDNVWAVGSWQRQPLLIHWDGKAWGVNPCPAGKLLDYSMMSWFTDIAVAPGGEVYIIGEKSAWEKGHGKFRSFILRPASGITCPETIPVPSRTPYPTRSLPTEEPTSPATNTPRNQVAPSPTQVLPTPIPTSASAPGPPRTGVPPVRTSGVPVP